MLEGNGPFTATQLREHEEEAWRKKNEELNKFLFELWVEPLLNRALKICVEKGWVTEEELDAVADNNSTVPRR